MALEVSVALCTRNGARYLPDQVRSICAQEPPPQEIVLSDDGSTDDTLAVVRDTLAQCGMADRIALRVFSNSPPLGVTRNFEQAVRACSHDLIALCDQDDVWHPGRLARMVAQFEARPDLLLLHTDARLVDGDLKPLGSTLFHALEVRPAELEAIASGEAFGVLQRRNLVTGATTMFRKTLLDAALPFAPEWVHDEWLAAVAAATGRMDVLPEPTIDYRQHGNNQIGARRLTLSEKVAKAFVARGDKHVARLRRAEALLQRLEQLGGRVRAGCLDAQRDKVAHQRFRAGLPAARPLRLLPILLEAARGRYARFGRGKQAIVQDVFERG
ncbi:glycosyltransferase family 2 protein [Variovorax sp. NFACC27]|uniref:glycosyltransferase family 2 protein n=1 Tax=unclassified Variovorax TaxID=663243 RepID=UPI000898DFA5|nr:Glycosyltransferase involved in cell wall bisynthesis [Variovorax sp. NFACC28]SEF66510.1 Glycosyltransferase involved in cell wall bisynthesis [Variovorax sp. NFACC29]SFB74787.1 Glycosyltransferase involved in cell wall bisynthesis [Variovorax sp. NFACC26]SFG54615.1 Glycosyltransferase involved in cell wall bisynthesis [Variovorax sp. NFACC27]